MNISVDNIASDNPEDLSLEVTRVSVNLNSRETELMDELRGGDTVIEFFKKRLGIERDPEHIEQMMEDQKQPFEPESA